MVDRIPAYTDHLTRPYQPDSLQVYGTAEEGYIVAPPPPTHLPVRPPASSPGVVSAALAASPTRTLAEGSRPSGRRARAQQLDDDMLALRLMLITRIKTAEGPVTYAEAAAHIGRIPIGLGPVLDLLEQHCTRRGEPNLAVLVVNKTTRTPTKYASLDWRTDQVRCLTYGW